MNTLHRFIQLIGVVILMTACTNKSAMQSETGFNLKGTWELNYITGPRIAFDGLYPKQKPSLVFTDLKTEVNGHTSCNSFSAPVKIEKGSINFGDIRSTLMACEGIGEPTFVSMLKKINKYSVSGNTLTLITGDIAMMRFSKVK